MVWVILLCHKEGSIFCRISRWWVSFLYLFYTRRLNSTWHQDIYDFRSSNANGCGSTASLYIRLVVPERGDILGKTLRLDDNQLDSLFQQTFGPKILNTFQKSLTWRCYRVPLHIRAMLTRHSQLGPMTGLRYDQERKTVLHAIIQCPKVSELWAYEEHLLSNTRRVQLSSCVVSKNWPRCFSYHRM